MDILIKTLSRDFLTGHVEEFIDILKSEPNEYWGVDNFLSELNSKYELSVVALDSGFVAGYIIASLKEDGPYIHKFMVRDTFRGKSVGKKMLDFFETKSARLNHHAINLAVLEENEDAIRFYEKNGFRVSGKRTDSKTGSPLLLMTKLLTL